MAPPAIMWFRNDLRLADNAALRAAAAAGPLVCVYVLDDETPGNWRMGAASRWWLHRSLESLGRSVRLILRRGQADQSIARLLEETGAAAVHFTRGYEPWAGDLEERVKAACGKAGAACLRFGGYLLHHPEAIRSGAGEPYKVFTPFLRACLSRGAPPPPAPAPKLSFLEAGLASDRLEDWDLLPRAPNWAQGFEAVWQPGEAGGRARLSAFLCEGVGGYAKGRDRPAQAGSSRLSPHLHFGEIGPAQVWQAVAAAVAGAGGKRDAGGETYLKELLWREFSYHLLQRWPRMPDEPFRAEFAGFPWLNDPAGLKAWREGRTGYPIVDAGMRELWATGFMHNRVRMIAASFLVKQLLQPWQEGERWYWDTLVDADIGNNAMNWQWVAGCGADAAPYFRIFNPVLQGEKFDPQGSYVRKWLPELAALPDRFVHRPWEAPAVPAGYPRPVVDLAVARERALAAFAKIRSSRRIAVQTDKEGSQ